MPFLRKTMLGFSLAEQFHESGALLWRWCYPQSLQKAIIDNNFVLFDLIAAYSSTTGSSFLCYYFPQFLWILVEHGFDVYLWTGDAISNSRRNKLFQKENYTALFFTGGAISGIGCLLWRLLLSPGSNE